MADLLAITCNWSGTGVNGLATSTFYTDLAHAAASVTALPIFFNAFRTYLPGGLRIDVPNSGKTYNEATGALTGGWIAGTAGIATGSSATPFPSSSGALLSLNSGTIVNGRLLKGRIFIVPLAGNAYGFGGIEGGCVTAIKAAAVTLLTSAGDFNFKVWHRPKAGAGGSSAFVSGSNVSSRACVLKSRRD